ncbi:MAG: hypothetical protein HC831_14095 [Chloroflexia bacterium]|nr:hypothetical protein [Chloroflexia bacterium]
MLGKFLFSDRPIVVGEEDPAQFKTEFAPTDKIYSIAYLKGSIKDLTKDDKIGNYKLTIDGGNSQYISFGHNPEDMGLGYYLIEIVPHTDKAIHGLDCKEFAKSWAVYHPVLTNLSWFWRAVWQRFSRRNF